MLINRVLPWQPIVTIVEPFTTNFIIEPDSTAVVIDVLRAFSNLAYLFHTKMLGKVLVAPDFATMRELRAQYPEYLMMGELDGVVPEDFNLGNSPSRSLDPSLNVAGKTALLSTSAGTVGLLRALDVTDQVVTGSFVNIGATVTYLRQKQPRKVTLIACGNGAKVRAIEDYLFAEHLRSRLLGESPRLSVEQIREEARTDKYNLRFFDEQRQALYPKADFDMSFEEKSAVVLVARRVVINGVILAEITAVEI